MVIYAFYGLGKTTLANQDSKYIDADKFYFKNEYRDSDKIILTNDINIKADMYFLPKDLETHKKRLKELNKLQFFEQYPNLLENEYNEILKRNPIFVKYLTDTAIKEVIENATKRFY